MAYYWNASRPRYWKPWGYRRGKGGWVMARRASRPATPFAHTEITEPATKRSVVVEDYMERPRYIAPSRNTRSALVKLTANISFDPLIEGEGSVYRARAYSFTLDDIPGFLDYRSIYSEYRIVKGEIVIPTPMSSTTTTYMINLLVVSSQPFAQTAVPITGNGPDAWVPQQTEAALRQTRWQRVIYPETTTTGVRVGFRPYTMVSTGGPAGATNVQYQRIWSGAAWTPFTWSSDTNPITYFGPYIFPQNTSMDAPQLTALQTTVVLYCYFKGQK